MPTTPRAASSATRRGWAARSAPARVAVPLRGLQKPKPSATTGPCRSGCWVDVGDDRSGAGPDPPTAACSCSLGRSLPPHAPSEGALPLQRPRHGKSEHGAQQIGVGRLRQEAPRGHQLDGHQRPIRRRLIVKARPRRRTTGGHPAAAPRGGTRARAPDPATSWGRRAGAARCRMAGKETAGDVSCQSPGSARDRRR